MIIASFAENLLVRSPHSMLLPTTHSEASCAMGVRRNIGEQCLFLVEVSGKEESSPSLKLRRTE